LSLVGKSVSTIEISAPKDAIPTGSAVFVVGANVAVFLEVKGRIDIDEEINKAQTKLKKASEGASKLIKTLNDKDFLEKVSSGVLETEKSRLEEFRAQERNYERSIEQFTALKLESS
jgi:valyl-tRNA synthetase